MSLDVRIPGYIQYNRKPNTDDYGSTSQTPMTLLRTNPKKPIVIVIQSVIGAGKSTLLTILEEFLREKLGDGRAVTIQEPIDVWNKTGALVDFGANPKAMCVEFQMFAFATRIKRVREMYRANPNADIYIIERDPNADKIFMEMLRLDNTVSDKRMDRYLMTWEIWMEFWPFEPTYTVHLGPSLDECQKRVLSRARPGESIVDLEYQTKLLIQHEVYYLEYCKTPVLRINEDGDFRVKNSDVRKRVIQNILDFAGIK